MIAARFYAVVACALLPAFALAAPPARFVHPGMLQSRADLQLMKGKVAASEPPWKQAWDNLLRQPYSSRLPRQGVETLTGNP